MRFLASYSLMFVMKFQPPLMGASKVPSAFCGVKLRVIVSYPSVSDS